MSSLRLKRVYEQPEAGDGMRILVDRLWPRGLAKAKARIDLWLKDIAPSDALRKRFHAKPDDWGAFCAAYAAELEGDAGAGALKDLRELSAQRAGHPALCGARRAAQQCGGPESVAGTQQA